MSNVMIAVRENEYKHVVFLRVVDEDDCDPEQYRKAAYEFRTLGMTGAAERCEELAKTRGSARNDPRNS